jgi:hypothetical protein
VVLDDRPHLQALSARRLAPLALALLALAGCGSSKSGWHKALPCLRGNADAVVDVGRPQILPFQSTQPPDFRKVTAPRSFDRELDLSFPTTQPGANGLQLLFYSSDESPRRMLAELDRSIHAISTQGALLTGASIERVGKHVLLWSSRPTTTQRGAVVGCLD